MRAVLRTLLLLQALVPVHALAADEKLSIELNSTETAENRCRMNFVVENKSNVTLESMKLVLADGEQSRIGRLQQGAATEGGAGRQELQHCRRA